MKSQIFPLSILPYIFLIYGCNDANQNNHLTPGSFEFHISSLDHSGLIQLPHSIENQEIANIHVDNKPLGSYEIFTVELKDKPNQNYVIYKGFTGLDTDEICFNLKTEKEQLTKVVAKLSPIRDANCQNQDALPNYSFSLVNHQLALKPGDKFRIQMDGFISELPASSSLLPDCGVIQDYGIRTTLLTRLTDQRLFPITKSKTSNYKESYADEDGIRFTNYEKNGPLFISGKVPDHSTAGEYVFVYGILIHKMFDGRFSPHFKLFPEASWEWKEQLSVHKYGIITFNISL